MSERELLKIASQMASRMELWEKMRRQAEERGDVLVELQVPELFEAEDAKALGAWREYVKNRRGEVPLFDEV